MILQAAVGAVSREGVAIFVRHAQGGGRIHSGVAQTGLDYKIA